MIKFKNLVESTYQELQDMGYKMTTDKPDGRQASMKGKNLNAGYWKKKLEDCTESGDKIGMRYAKEKLKKLMGNKKKLKETDTGGDALDICDICNIDLDDSNRSKNRPNLCNQCGNDTDSDDEIDDTSTSARTFG